MCDFDDNEKGWYYSVCYGRFGDIKRSDVRPISSKDVFVAGPFKTFQDARYNAGRFFEYRLESADTSIMEIMGLEDPKAAGVKKSKRKKTKK